MVVDFSALLHLPTQSLSCWPLFSSEHESMAADPRALLRLQASLSEMIPPGALVMLTPVIVGVLFGTRTLAGVLAGALVSGVQMAVSMSNTGGGGPHSR